MKNQMRNIGNMGTKLLNKALITNHMNQYQNFFFRSDVIMAHSPNIQLVASTNFDGQHEMKKFNFLKIIRLSDS